MNVGNYLRTNKDISKTSDWRSETEGNNRFDLKAEDERQKIGRKPSDRNQSCRIEKWYVNAGETTRKRKLFIREKSKQLGVLRLN